MIYNHSCKCRIALLEEIRWIVTKTNESSSGASAGAITEEQLKALHIIFGRLDSDGSGAIDMPELKDALQYVKKEIKRSGKNIMSNAELDRMFEEMDQDGDGEVSFSEFKYAMVSSGVVNADPTSSSALTLRFLKEYAMDHFRVETLKKIYGGKKIPIIADNKVDKGNSSSSNITIVNDITSTKNGLKMSHNINSNSVNSPQEKLNSPFLTSQDITDLSKFRHYKSIFQTHNSIHLYDTASNNEIGKIKSVEEFHEFKESKVRFVHENVIPSKHMVFIGVNMKHEDSNNVWPKDSLPLSDSVPKGNFCVDDINSSNGDNNNGIVNVPSSPSKSRYYLQYPFDMNQIWELVYRTGVARPLSEKDKEEDGPLPRLHCIMLSDPSKMEYKKFQELGIYLLSYGHIVNSFSTGQDMLAKIVENDYDVCFMSGTLPLFDGPGTIRMLTEFEIPILKFHYRPSSTLVKCSELSRVSAGKTSSIPTFIPPVIFESDTIKPLLPKSPSQEDLQRLVGSRHSSRLGNVPSRSSEHNNLPRMLRENIEPHSYTIRPKTSSFDNVELNYGSSFNTLGRRASTSNDLIQMLLDHNSSSDIAIRSRSSSCNEIINDISSQQVDSRAKFRKKTPLIPDSQGSNMGDVFENAGHGGIDIPILSFDGFLKGNGNSPINNVRKQQPYKVKIPNISVKNSNARDNINSANMGNRSVTTKKKFLESLKYVDPIISKKPIRKLEKY